MTRLFDAIRDWWARNVIAPADDPWADVIAAAEHSAGIDLAVNVAPESAAMWAELDAEEAWAQIEDVLGIPQQREPGGES